MSDLTELEITDRMIECLRGAAEDCELLAKLPAQGPTFARMRERLALVEGCCRQMTFWREDSRWLQWGIAMEAVHQRSREWIVKHVPREAYLKLAEILRNMMQITEDLRTRATGRTGMILPDPAPAPHRESKPVQVLGMGAEKRTPSGLILPPAYH